jgi:hypothetical protein
MQRAAREAAFCVLAVAPVPAGNARAAGKIGQENAARPTKEPGRQCEDRLPGLQRNNAKK